MAAGARTRQLAVSVCLLLTTATGSAQDRGFYIETPFVYQADNYCGAAALAIVMQYWGRGITQYELALNVKPFPRDGLSGDDLKSLADRYGFLAFSFQGKASAIQEHLRQGRPIVVALRASALLNQNHYVVVVGWDPGREEWIVQDPATGPYRRYAADAFAERRGKLDNWALLALPSRPD